MPLFTNGKTYLSPPEIASWAVEQGYAKTMSSNRVRQLMSEPDWPVPADEQLELPKRTLIPLDGRLEKFFKGRHEDPERQRRAGEHRARLRPRYYELRAQGVNITAAARELGIARKTAVRWEETPPDQELSPPGRRKESPEAAVPRETASS